MILRKLLPYSARVKVRLLRRGLNDLQKGYLFSFAQRQVSGNEYSSRLEITQDVPLNNASLPKRHNFAQAIRAIESYEIQPKEIFSFWKIVGNPSLKRGFVESRSIVNGEVKPSVGGGLCQLSGLIYYASLQANLDIIERYNHSADIYTEETRFTPLGSDATVAYAYRDLRIRNNFNFPVKFNFSLTDANLTIKLCSPEAIAKSKVEFKTEKQCKNETEVVTLINDVVLNKSKYIKATV